MDKYEILKNDFVVILPVKNKYALAIASGQKKIEFRKYLAPWVIGQEIWIVATGKAKFPREIIAKTLFAGNINPEDVKKIDHDVLAGSLIGGFVLEKDFGWRFLPLGNCSIPKVDPFPLASLGIKNTPQKYMYYKKINNS